MTLAVAGLAGGALPGGRYRLTLFSTPTRSVHDLSGLALDGDGNGTAGGDYVREFTVRGYGVTVAPTGGLVTTEAGGTAAFTVVLDRQPATAVSIAVASAGAIEGVAAPAVLTFTPENWDVPQTVTVTGRPDDLDDGSVGYTVALAPAVSDAPEYAGLDPADVSLTNVNNPPAITSDGGGATAAMSVSENTTAVTVVSATDPDGGTRSFGSRSPAGRTRPGSSSTRLLGYSGSSPPRTSRLRPTRTGTTCTR